MEAAAVTWYEPGGSAVKLYEPSGPVMAVRWVVTAAACTMALVAAVASSSVTATPGSTHSAASKTVLRLRSNQTTPWTFPSAADGSTTVTTGSVLGTTLVDV